MKLNYKRTFFVGLAFMSICAFWQVYDNAVSLILKNTFHVRDSYIGVVLALDNILALFMLPLFGNLSAQRSAGACHTFWAARRWRWCASC